MGRKATACLKCAAIKAKCTGQTPCSRCQRLRLPCSFKAGASTADVGDAGHSPRDRDGIRARHTKSSTGCVNCRRRRKKCDELKPTCGDCARLRLQCLPREVSSHQSFQLQEVSASPGEAVDREPDGYGSDGDQPPAPPLLDWLDIISKENLADSSSSSSLAHSSALKVLPDARASDTAPSEEGATLPPIALSTYAGIDPVCLDSWTTGERHLLNHFLQSVARTMSIADDQANPFIRLVVPLAFESKAVRNALAALSATHLAKLYPDFERNHLVHRDMALEDLGRRLGSADMVGSLAATLLLCIGEICECRSKKWLLYLHGARALLGQLHNAQTPLVDFLIDLFNYICCVACVTSSEVPSPLGRKLGRFPASEGTHTLFGREPGLYRYLPHITRLATERPLDLDAKAQALDNVLTSWPSLREINSEEQAASCAIRWAMVLLLRQLTSPDLQTTSPQVQVPVNNINAALSLVRPGSRYETHLLFPMLMSGVGSVTKASRLVIECRISVAERTMGFGSVTAVHSLLDTLWRRADNGGRVLAWQEILQEQMPGLMLF